MFLITAMIAGAWAQDYPAMINSAGQTIHWYEFPVEYVVNGGNDQGMDPDGLVYAAVSAGSAWNRVAGADVDMAFGGTTDIEASDADGLNIIHIPARWEWSSDLLALTSLWSKSDGTAVGFDMEINAVDHDWTVDGEPGLVDVENTLCHEFGHAIGIGHITYDVEATMYPSAPLGEVAKRDLAHADEDVLVHFYPDGTAGSDVDSGSIDPFAACSGSAAPPVLLATLLAAALLGRRRTPLTLAPSRAR